MRRAVHACILPILTYGTPAWWPGRTRTNGKGDTIQNGMETNCNKLDKAQNVALCAVLPVWKTTPIFVLQREAATPPIHHTLDYLCELASLRLHKLEARHPLRIQTKQAHITAYPTRLERLAKKCSGNVDYLNPAQELEPWEQPLFDLDSCLAAVGGTACKEKAVTKFDNWLKSRKSLDIIVYTDGSQEIDKSNTPTGTGAGWVLSWVGSWHQKQGASLGKSIEIHDAEAIAVLEGLKQALKSPMARVSPKIHIYLDNLEVARNAGGIPKTSSQEAFTQFRDLAKSWLQSGKELAVQWVPGHAGIEGNELADQEAKKFAKLPPIAGLNLQQSVSSAKRKIRKMKEVSWQLEWENSAFSGAAQTYLDLGLKPTSRAKSLPDLKLKREVQGWLIAARSGHGHFSAYHERFEHEGTDSNCLCGQKRSQLHPFSCAYAREHRQHLTPDEVLGTPEGVAAFAKWAPATGLFHWRYGVGGEEGDGGRGE